MSLATSQDGLPATKVRRGYVYLISTVAAVGGFIFGYDMMIMGGAIVILKRQFALPDRLEGFAMISANLGMIATLFFAGRR